MTKEKLSIEEHVYQQLKNAIFNRKIPLNTQLNEELLSDAFNVSRTPIRSVLRKLEYEKVIDNVPNKGAYIYQPSKKELKDVFQLRILIEKEAIKLACESATEEQLKHLIAVTEKEEEHFRKGDYAKGLQLTTQFHKDLVKLAGNEMFNKYNNELINITNIYLVFHETAHSESPRSPDEHRRIIEAISEKNVDEALNLFNDHFESIRQHLGYEETYTNISFSDIFTPYNKD